VKLVLIGCEYTGTTTLALGLNEWAEKTIGSGFRIIHDHWKLPHTSGHLPTDTAHFLDADEQAQVLALSPKLKEMTQRHSLYYHTPSAPDDENRLILGYLFDDGIYGPLYFEYGRPTDPEDRSVVGRAVENTLLKNAPETVLVMLKATPEVIRARMKKTPHAGGVLREPDVEFVLERFDSEFKYSLISKKFALDTSESTPAETLAQFVANVEKYLTEVDRSRIMLHSVGLKAG